MKRLANALLSTLILGILLTSCGGKASHVQGDLVVHRAYIQCPKITKPNYNQLVVGEYFLGPGNSKTLLDNMEVKENYLKELENTLKRYSSQSE